MNGFLAHCQLAFDVCNNLLLNALNWRVRLLWLLLLWWRRACMVAILHRTLKLLRTWVRELWSHLTTEEGWCWGLCLLQACWLLLLFEQLGLYQRLELFTNSIHLVMQWGAITSTLELIAVVAACLSATIPLWRTLVSTILAWFMMLMGAGSIAIVAVAVVIHPTECIRYQ